MTATAHMRSGLITGVALATAAGLGLGLAAAPAAGADFYKNKRISIYIGSAPGTGYDQYGRLLGRNIGRHIPGQPSFLPRNMPGASGRRALNYIHAKAKRDGTALGHVIRGALFDPLMYPGKGGVDFDVTKLTWIGSANNEVTTCVTWHTSGFKTVDDFRKKSALVGATGPNSTGSTFPKLLNQIAGTKIRVVTGYPSSSQVHLAMEREEVHGRCGLGYDSIVARMQNWLKDKKINIVVQFGLRKHKDIPNVPAAIDMARNDGDRRVMELLFGPNLMGRPFFGPPGIPKDRADLLRAAFTATMKDPAFLNEAKNLDVAIDPLNGTEMAALVKRIYGMPKNTIEDVRAILASSSGVSKRKANYYDVNAKILEVKRKGGRISFMEKGKKVQASVGGRGTKITIAGKKAKRSALKTGLDCTITYEGHRTEAKTIACK
jgi:tripartite-type tricarboxylate transporter receptor subunit TctC